MEPGGVWWTNILTSAFPPARHRPAPRPEDQDPVIHTAQNKREGERKKEREREKGRKAERKERKKERKMVSAGEC